VDVKVLILSDTEVALQKVLCENPIFIMQNLLVRPDYCAFGKKSIVVNVPKIEDGKKLVTCSFNKNKF
jgi:hypothetical protein